jgi:glycosyltransferase involved in cell wall biosynthesis
MHLLLVAHEFPPSTSPQAMRWDHLTAEMVKLGHRVTILAPEDRPVDDNRGRSIVRTDRGPVHRFVLRVSKFRRRESGLHANAGLPATMRGLNWRGRSVFVLARLMGALSFPDLRRHWNRGARAKLLELIALDRPDVVITSHEPASVLELGFLAKSAGIPWVADLGDPIVAPYTPWYWRATARALEARTCAGADLIVTTTVSLGQYLARKHDLPSGRMMVLRQGFNCHRPVLADPQPVDFDKGTLELLFTGQFYAFRDPAELISAVGSTEGIRLTIISVSHQERLKRISAASGGRLRLLGPMQQAQVMQWQAAADVLVNMGNDLPHQVPGKLFEYFGATRPILQISCLPHDEGGSLVREYRRGWVVPNRAMDISRQLASIKDAWMHGRLDAGLDLKNAIAEFAWENLAKRLEKRLDLVAGRAAVATQ